MSAPRITISLSDIETDASRPAGWTHGLAAPASAAILLAIIAAGPGQLGGVVQGLVPGRVRPDPFFLWLAIVIGGVIGLAVQANGWLARTRHTLELDTVAGMIRLRRGGLWSRHTETLEQGDVADLALVATEDDGVPAWRLEFRTKPASGRAPLHVATTHHLDRLETLARRITADSGLALTRVGMAAGGRTKPSRRPKP